MPRPQKKRYVCCVPKNTEFAPADISGEEPIILNVDEYEAVRLIDREGATQEECAKQMHVSRTTVQGVYNNARKKIANALVDGRRLLISGGDYVMCDSYQKRCGKGCHKHCHRHQCRLENQSGE